MEQRLDLSKKFYRLTKHFKRIAHICEWGATDKITNRQ